MKSKSYKLFCVFALVGLAVFGIGGIGGAGHSRSANGGQKIYDNPNTLAQEQPILHNARVKGSKIILSGESFAPGVVVFVNGKAHNTVRDDRAPTTVVVVKKIFKTVEAGEIASLQAINPNSVMSDSFAVFIGKSITIDDAGRTITLAVGEKVELLLYRQGYNWKPEVLDPTILELAPTDATEKGQGIFKALRPGTTKLLAVGSACPPNNQIQCGVPRIHFEVTITVQ